MTKVRPGDGVKFGFDGLENGHVAKRGCVARQNAVAATHGWLPVFHDGRFNFYGDRAPMGPIPEDLLTLSDEPVTGYKEEP